MLPTGSATPRAMVCVASAVLPKTESASEAAGRGNAKHAFFCDLQKMSREDALERVPDEYRELAEAVDVEKLREYGALDPSNFGELALAYDVETEATRVIGINIGRNYGAVGENEIAMSLDVAAVCPDGESVYVGDFKTGYGDVTPAYRNWQLMTGAIAMARLKKLDRTIVSIIRVRADGRPWFDVAEFDAFALMGIASDLRVMAKRIAVERAHVASGVESENYPLRAVTGDHCKYCPSFQFCPAQKALITRMAGDPHGIETELANALTPETAALAYQKLKAVEAVTKRVRKALYGYAANHPIPLENGMVFGPVETTKEVMDPKVAFEVMGRLHGPAIADAACERKISQASIERALKPISPKGTLAAKKRATMGELRVANAFSTKRSEDIDEYDPNTVEALAPTDHMTAWEKTRELLMSSGMTGREALAETRKTVEAGLTEGEEIF